MKPLIKIIIVVTSICIFCVIGMLFQVAFNNSNLFADGIPINNSIKKTIGIIKYGNKKCSINGDLMAYIKEYGILNANDPEHPLFGGAAMSEGRCGICKRKDVYGNTSHPRICDDCAKITNRCDTCGKLIEQENN